MKVNIQNVDFILHEITFGEGSKCVYCDAEFASIYKSIRQTQNATSYLRMWVSICTYEICAPAGARVIIGSRVFLVNQNELTPVLDHPRDNSNWGAPCTKGFTKPYMSRWQLSLALARVAGRVIEIDCGGNCPVSSIFREKENYKLSQYVDYFFEFVHKYEKTYKIGRGLDEYYETSQRRDVLITLNWAELTSYR